MAAKGRVKRNNASVYTNNTSSLADKDKDDTYNRVYEPPINTEEEGSGKDDGKEEEEDNSGDNNGTSDSAGNSKDKAGYKLGDSGLCCKADANIYVYYV
ncbi:hypothetical protein P8C59_005285 [Phyllachora maydis]|uniref:Uncharacterized protein n=1 Tax=Phyllachora maydis TaxID=1825666 RepID=A0AAD9MEC8_9PEZI|nr:hypothetical protein P8C59_005285 [Phyllachora maydis]